MGSWSSVSFITHDGVRRPVLLRAAAAAGGASAPLAAPPPQRRIAPKADARDERAAPPCVMEDTELERMRNFGAVPKANRLGNDLPKFWKIASEMTCRNSDAEFSASRSRAGAVLKASRPARLAMTDARGAPFRSVFPCGTDKLQALL